MKYLKVFALLTVSTILLALLIMISVAWWGESFHNSMSLFSGFEYVYNLVIICTGYLIIGGSLFCVTCVSIFYLFSSMKSLFKKKE